jgi:carboxylesterase type B
MRRDTERKKKNEEEDKGKQEGKRRKQEKEEEEKMIGPRMGSCGGGQSSIAKLWWLVACLFALAIYPSAVSSVASDLTITTPQGIITGTVEQGIRVFRGIPYTLPPVGTLRWKSPGPSIPALPSQPYDASAYKSHCAQPDSINAAGWSGSEDCLYLNVFTPLGASASLAKLPVYVFLHGGGFVTGSPHQYPAHRFVTGAHNIVVVTVAYRLGAFGFLAHSALSDERGVGQTASSGNFGIEDQRAALKWVRANIAAYGGNPLEVILGGHGTGATSTCLHVISPLSGNLFSKVMLMSGGCDGLKTLGEGEAKGAAFANALTTAGGTEATACNGVNGAAAQLACFRSSAITPAVIVSAMTTVGALAWFSAQAFWPVVDGVNFMDYTENSLTLAQSAPGSDSWIRFPVQCMVGFTNSEMAEFTAPTSDSGWFPDPSPDNIVEMARTLSKGNAEIVEYYTNAATVQLGSATFPDVYTVYTNLLSRYFQHCPARRMAARRCETAYVYSWNYTSPFAASQTELTRGAPHGSDVPFAFSTAGMLQPGASTLPGVEPSSSLNFTYSLDARVSNVLRGWMLGFLTLSIAYVDRLPSPVGPGDLWTVTTAAWPSYGSGAKIVMKVQPDGGTALSQILLVEGLLDRECDMWERNLWGKTASFVPRIVGGNTPSQTTSSSTGSAAGSGGAQGTTAGEGSSTGLGAATAFYPDWPFVLGVSLLAAIIPFKTIV